MKTDFWFSSQGIGQIHGSQWLPEGQPRGVVQIVHGITESVEKYDHFAHFLTSHGFLVVAEDHMGHGQSVNGGGLEGYFHGGWFAAVDDTAFLLRETRKEYPGLPYFLLGHSMGSFLARNLLYLHPDSVDGVILSGTAWQPDSLLPGAIAFLEGACRAFGETAYNETFQNLIFRRCNARVEHPRTLLDWACRDSRVVNEHVILRFGMLRDMVQGVQSVQQPENLAKMNKALPVLLISGGDDPVGDYGKGVRACAAAFQKTGMQDVSLRIYPLCRHEVLNELNRDEVYGDILRWMEKRIN